MKIAQFRALDESNFETQVIARAGVSVVDFWSTTCIPCRQMTRLLREIATEIAPDVLIGQVDADKNPQLVDRFGVRDALFTRAGPANRSPPGRSGPIR